MSLSFKLLLFVHFVALAVAATTNIAMPLLARTLMPDGRVAFGRLARRLSLQAQLSLWVLIATGLAMAWPVYFTNGIAGLGPWFTAKLVLVAAIVILTLARYVPGLPPLPPRLFAPLSRGLLLGIVLCAVMAFA